ncbi:PLC-like phosphodiesterase [Xylariaceae sp. FL1019]|nr:PLC-like phosphodiesterase [Xylariaceae sp. FL1019]
MRLTTLITTLLTHISLASADYVSDFALQKVLSDSAEVFGYYEPSSSSSSSRAEWMKSISDSTPITQLNIPGTHDAATWNYSQTTQDSLSYATRCDGVKPGIAKQYRCQTKSISQSLEAGIRFFDLRYAYDPVDAHLVFWHGAALLSAKATVEDVLFGFYAWLSAHPSEFVILSFQYEPFTKANATAGSLVQGELYRVLNTPAAKHYISQSRGVTGTLGEHRGKILLFRRFDLDELPREVEGSMPGLHMSPEKWWVNGKEFKLVYNESSNGTAFIEDYFYPWGHKTIEDNVEAKFAAVQSHLFKASTGPEDGLFVTFTSGTHVGVDPPVYPETMALGGDGDEGGVNLRLAGLLGRLQGARLGIVVLDFWEEPEDLVDLVLGWDLKEI